MSAKLKKTAQDEGLKRFIYAQNSGCYDGLLSEYDVALSEISIGQKSSHWIWFIFPQLKGIGMSAMCEKYGIRGSKEAKAYLRNKVLYDRLIEITKELIEHQMKDINEVMGSEIDALKLRSCMTLFASVATKRVDRDLFMTVLKLFFGGEPCPITWRMLLEEKY